MKVDKKELGHDAVCRLKLTEKQGGLVSIEIKTNDLKDYTFEFPSWAKARYFIKENTYIAQDLMFFTFQRAELE